ncbi:MAG: hypothetical protein AB7Q17_12530 [Phycisphaerae bacterium]
MSSNLPPPNDPVVRGHCACGKRYRIRNPLPGAAVKCPGCGRVITIDRADLVAALSGGAAVPLAVESQEAKEAILIDQGAVRPAARGSRPGLAEGVAYSHEDALLASALAGRPMDRPVAAIGNEAEFDEVAPGKRSFVYDALISFALALRPRNAIALVARAALFALALTIVLLIPWVFFVIPLCLMLVLLAFVLAYCWQVLKTTAFGVDELPRTIIETDFYNDVLWPAFWLLLVSGICSIPTIAARALSNELDAASRGVLMQVATYLGWILWPATVLMAANRSAVDVLMRPDRIVRVAMRLGLPYLLVLAMLAATGWVMKLAVSNSPSPSAASIAEVYAYLVFTTGAAFYTGYVTSRLIGLLYRHYPEKFEFDAGAARSA